MIKKIILSVLLCAPFFSQVAYSQTCERFYASFTPSLPHDALLNSAFGIDYTKLGAVFIVQKEGLPFYAPQWKFGVFKHLYPAVALSEEGALSPTVGSAGSFKKGTVLVLASMEENESQVTLKLLSNEKFSIKADDPKPTDRVSLGITLSKKGNSCALQKAFQSWLKGFGGWLEMERFQRVGDVVPVTAPPAGESSKSKKSHPAKIQNTESLPPEPAPIAPIGTPLSPTGERPSRVATEEVSLSSGMPRDKIEQSLGKPHQVVQLGEKVICTYDDVVIEYVKGKLVDVRLSDKPSPEVLKRFH